MSKHEPGRAPDLRFFMWPFARAETWKGRRFEGRNLRYVLAAKTWKSRRFGGRNLRYARIDFSLDKQTKLGKYGS